MNDSMRCAPTILADGQVLRVEYCRACDVLSLHFGPITLRLHPEAAEGAWATLGDALRMLHRARERSGLPRGRPRQDLAS